MRDPARGAAFVEFAIVATLLLGLLGAAVDFGLAWRRSAEVASTLRSGVRVVANLGDDRGADHEALLSLNAGIREIGLGNIIRVVVFESATADGRVPAGCRSVTPNASSGAGISTSTTKCNVYGPEQLASLTAARFSGSATGCQSDDWDRWYCPIDREDRQGAPGGADYVGVWVQWRIDWVVDVLPGDGLTTEDTAVMRIEPRL